MTPDDNLTELLSRAAAGDREAANAAFGVLYPRLRSMAHRLMRSQRKSHTLDPEGLLHEAYLRVRRSGPGSWASRGHFLAYTAQVMRTCLVDHARQRNAKMRGGGAAAEGRPSSGYCVEYEDRMIDLLTLDDVLAQMARLHPDSACVLELTYSFEMPAAAVAAEMGWSLRSVERELQFARNWIRGEFER